MLPLKTLASTLVDRLVVEVNGEAFSQRDLEVYLLVKQVLQGQPPETAKFVATNWKGILAEFTEDMLIRQETDRLGSFQASVERFKTSLKQVQSAFKTQNFLRTETARLGIDNKSLVRSVTFVLRIMVYKENKERQFPRASKTSSPVWSGRLKERAFVRIYEDARRFKKIEPLNGLSY